MSRFHMLVFAAALSACTTACSDSPGTPSAPSAPPATTPVAPPAAGRPDGAQTMHGQPLTAVIGTGAGIVNVTPTAAVDGSFSAQIHIAVHGAPPNTTFYVQRAPEIGRPNSADGVCQRAAGEPPWGAPVPNFVTFPLPAPGPLVTLRTSPGGAGAAHIDFGAPTIPDGTRFDVMFRLVDDLTSPSTELRTPCFTVTVK